MRAERWNLIKIARNQSSFRRSGGAPIECEWTTEYGVFRIVITEYLLLPLISHFTILRRFNCGTATPLLLYRCIMYIVQPYSTAIQYNVAEDVGNGAIEVRKHAYVECGL